MLASKAEQLIFPKIKISCALQISLQERCTFLSISFLHQKIAKLNALVHGMAPCKYTLITFVHCLMEPDWSERGKSDKDDCKLMHFFLWHQPLARDVLLLSSLSPNPFLGFLYQFALFIKLFHVCVFFNSGFQPYLLLININNIICSITFLLKPI